MAPWSDSPWNSAVRDWTRGRWSLVATNSMRCGPGFPRTFEKRFSAAKFNVRAFAKRGLRKNWFTEDRQGAIVGERFDPFQRVGIFITGRDSSLVSTAVMTCTLAAAAGVAQIVTVTPPQGWLTATRAARRALVECGAAEVPRIRRSASNCRSRFRNKDDPASAEGLRSGQRLRCGSKATGIRSRRDRLAAGPERNSCHRGRFTDPVDPQIPSPNPNAVQAVFILLTASPRCLESAPTSMSGN